MKDDHLSYIRNFCSCEKKERKKKGPEFSSGFLFATAKVAYKTAMIILHFNYKQDCRTTNKEAVFKLFNFYSYIIFGVGGRGGSKNYQEIKKGAELILLLLTGGQGGWHYIIISPLKLISEPPS